MSVRAVRVRTCVCVCVCVRVCAWLCVRVRVCVSCGAHKSNSRVTAGKRPVVSAAWSVEYDCSTTTLLCRVPGVHQHSLVAEGEPAAYTEYR